MVGMQDMLMTSDILLEFCITYKNLTSWGTSS